MKIHIPIILLLLFSAIGMKAQYIAEMHEYVPAPGQLINEAPWGTPSSAQSIIGDVLGSLSLGAFGGYVVFSFNDPIQNHPGHPYGVDFTIFGNPMPNWSEPGIVWVMKDENENGLPDDTWYQLAGSDYWFSSTVKNYEVTYANPGGTEPLDVSWFDNFGNTGFVQANSFHNHSFYPMNDSFPEIPVDSYVLTGTFLNSSVDTSNPEFVKSYERGFGYADNKARGPAPYTLPDNPYTPEVENAGGDAFDLSWAVDETGNYVDLDEAHFVKVQSALMGNGGWLGEISTEITGACLAEPNPGIIGENRMIVIKDLPPIIRQQNFQLETFAFFSGLIQTEEPITWETNQPWAIVNTNNILKTSRSGNVEITAYMANHPEISTTITANIELSSGITPFQENEKRITISPNPAKDHIIINGLGNASLNFYDYSGKRVKFINIAQNEKINIQDLTAGFYMVHFSCGNHAGSLKLIVR